MSSETRRDVLSWAVVAAATGVPWLVGWGVGWWAGLLAIGLLFWLYDRLFVPPGAVCMGIPFMLPLTGALVYLMVGVLRLLHRMVGTAG